MKAESLAALAQRIGPIVREYVAGVVAEYVKRLDAIEARAPLPGRDGLPGVPGPMGAQGEKGLDGAAGKDGRDGTLEQLKAQYDGERTIRLCSKATGEPIEGGVIVLPIPIYRKAYEEGRVYQRGDSVTYSGSLWIAQDVTEARPKEGGDDSRAWVLAVKQGPPGRPGAAGAKGLDGKDGRAGRDLTQMDAQGHKW